MNLVSTLLGISDIRCFAHNWDLAVKESCKTEALKTIITKSRKIVSHFNYSSTAKIALEKEQIRIGVKKKSLKQNIDTPWGSICAMLESVSENKLCLISYFDKIIKNNNSKRDEELKEMLLNNNEWALIHSLITPLDSIDAVY
jgi:hypothetical protein